MSWSGRVAESRWKEGKKAGCYSVSGFCCHRTDGLGCGLLPPSEFHACKLCACACVHARGISHEHSLRLSYHFSSHK